MVLIYISWLVLQFLNNFLCSSTPSSMKNNSRHRKWAVKEYCNYRWIWDPYRKYGEKWTAMRFYFCSVMVILWSFECVNCSLLCIFYHSFTVVNNNSVNLVTDNPNVVWLKSIVVLNQWDISYCCDLKVSWMGCVEVPSIIMRDTTYTTYLDQMLALYHHKKSCNPFSHATACCVWFLLSPFENCDAAAL
jgi:hypothetical protein